MGRVGAVPMSKGPWSGRPKNRGKNSILASSTQIQSEPKAAVKAALVHSRRAFQVRNGTALAAGSSGYFYRLEVRTASYDAG